MKFFVTFLFIISLLVFQTSYASNQYEAKIAVPNQSEAAKREALQKALSEIFVKDLGNDKILSNKETQEILSRAHDFIQSYKYLNEKKSGTLQKFIYITFDKEEIDQIIKRLRTLSTPASAPASKLSPTVKKSNNTIQTITSVTTKPVLIWLAVKTLTQETPVLIEYEQTNPMAKLIQLVGQRKNVSFLIPELDADIIHLISADNVWELDKTTIVEASTRYAMSNMLAGRLNQLENGQWEGKWLFKQDADWNEYETSGETPEANLMDIFDTIQKKLNTPTQLKATTENQKTDAFLIQVNQIQDLNKNKKLLNYLRALTIVKGVDTIGIQSNSVTLEIQAIGGKSAFQQMIEQADHNGKLIPVTSMELADNLDDETSPSKKKIELEYDWQDTTLPIDSER